MSNFYLLIIFSLGISLFLLSIVIINHNKTTGYEYMHQGEVLITKELQLLQMKWKQIQQGLTNTTLHYPLNSLSSSKETSILHDEGQKELKRAPHPHPKHHSHRSHSHLKMNCTVSYEPTCAMYPYVRFWNQRFYPNDCYQSPLRPPSNPTPPPYNIQKYVIFQPDGGGWNNIRMAAEVAILFAHTTGRTLVLPPAMKFYLLDKNNQHEENLSTFDTFFDLMKIKESVTIITMKEFLENIATKGLLKKPFPSDTTVQTMIENVQSRKKLWDYLEQSCYVESWCPGKQFIGFNIYHNPNTSSSSNNSNNVVFGSFNTNSPRLKEMIAHGRKLRPYNEQLHNEIAIYFPGDYRESHRILTHYYTYLYWEDPQIAKYYKRIVRDRLHYHDIIFCYSGFIVRQLHEISSKIDYKPLPSLHHASYKTLGGNSNLDATYYAVHIRRCDFQYQDTRLSAEKIWNNIKHFFNQSISSVIYISTDEKDKTFFKPFLQSGYTVKFLSDFLPSIKQHTFTFDETSNSNNLNKHHHLRQMKLNMNHIGMIEQVICANAHTFIGTPYSTFTGYITRMRGKNYCHISCVSICSNAMV